MSIQYENTVMKFYPANKICRGETTTLIGGPASVIPDADKCPSGRHNKKLTECYCYWVVR